jgi:hypothetical protein
MVSALVVVVGMTCSIYSYIHISYTGLLPNILAIQPTSSAQRACREVTSEQHIDAKLTLLDRPSRLWARI